MTISAYTNITDHRNMQFIIGNVNKKQHAKYCHEISMTKWMYGTQCAHTYTYDRRRKKKLDSIALCRFSLAQYLQFNKIFVFSSTNDVKQCVGKKGKPSVICLISVCVMMLRVAEVHMKKKSTIKELLGSLNFISSTTNFQCLFHSRCTNQKKSIKMFKLVCFLT